MAKTFVPLTVIVMVIVFVAGVCVDFVYQHFSGPPSTESVVETQTAQPNPSGPTPVEADQQQQAISLHWMADAVRRDVIGHPNGNKNRLGPVCRLMEDCDLTVQFEADEDSIRQGTGRSSLDQLFLYPCQDGRGVELTVAFRFDFSGSPEIDSGDFVTIVGTVRSIKMFGRENVIVTFGNCRLGQPTQSASAPPAKWYPNGDPWRNPTAAEMNEALKPCEKQCEDVMPTAELAESGADPIGLARTPRSGKWPSVRRGWLLEYPCCEACGRESLSNPVHHRYPFHQHPEWELMPYLPDGRRQFVTVCPEHHFQCHDSDGIDGPAKPNWSAANEHCIDDMAKIRNRNHPNAKWSVAPAHLNPTPKLAPPEPR